MLLLGILSLALAGGPAGGSEPEQEVVVPIRLDPDINGRHYYRGGAEDPGEQGLILQITAFREDFYLHLTPDARFLAPALATERLGVRLPALAAGSPDLRRCFYSGDVNGEPDSFAAVSLCGGLRGAFGYRGAEYVLSPLPNASAQAAPRNGQGAHLLRRRGAPGGPPGDPTSRCGVASGWNPAILRALDPYKPRGPGFGEGRSRRRSGRAKRFVSIPRYVETLVVADESMVKFHGADLEHYLLTLLATAARLYRHPSILNPINVVVVKVLLLGDRDAGPKVTGNAALTLRNFCAWQKKLNKVSDKHPEYWDTAILFTRQDLCGATTCDTLGMADVGTMCDPKRSCSVIEDDGLPSAFTTAHELGHVFNMPHDNVKVCEEVFGKLRANHMMSPTLIQIDRANPWSACSAAIITDFLDSGHGDCLLDAPSKPISLPEDLPGASYTLSQQCELAFGVGSKPCPYMQYCTKLWCTGKAKGQMVCQTRHFPWADGTSCGDGKFCLKGTCVERHNLNKYRVDGFWAKWEPYGACSRTCGGGVQLARRQCSNPTPANGGKYCEGMRVKYRSCNREPCPSSASGKSFREEQCEAFNGYNHSTNRLTLAVAWVPKYSGVSPQDKCKIKRRANGTGYFYVWHPASGPPCLRCSPLPHPRHGYNFVVAIPAGASSIDIRQRGYKGLIGDDNYLALKNSQGKYLLNGHFVVSAVERDLVVKGSLLRYSGTGTAVESLQASRPILEPLTVEVHPEGKKTPPRVLWSFYLPKEPREDRAPAEPRGAPGLLDGAPGLSNQVEPQGPRAAGRWVAGGWGPCSASCGGGGLQRRPVDCRGPAGPRPPSACRPAPRPADTRACGEPCASWQPGAWSPCSKSCGRGFKRRALQCLGPGGRLLARDRCDLRRKPQELDFCAARPC
eukprot:XP_022273769.1 LOW QUALITY PROTEIN: A disintegrin and metalloproteinase with thrombospondin motifs 15 [Canis lupus familiaris]